MDSNLNIFPHQLRSNITASWSTPARGAVFTEFPHMVPDEINEVLLKAGIKKLYRHQAECISAIMDGENVIISSGTASGKSLCYQIPILSAGIQNPESTALLLFPTKALSTDQLKGFMELIAWLDPMARDIFKTGVYDGDTTPGTRTAIRSSANILITNPDMLHIGILPHHPSWERFFTHLKYIVIDEAHIYSGVFGSHFANIIRRIKRIAAYYGADPQYILSSATVSNPIGFAAQLIEEEVKVFDKDYSAHGGRQFIFYNPPLVDPELGIRKNMAEESAQIARILLRNEIQTIIFSRSRISVEMMYKKLVQATNADRYAIAPYRSGYTKNERRIIEAGLKQRSIDLVIATVALELGIDMGMVDAIMMNGYPGSITRFLQQSGRAGRKNRKSLCIMVGSSLPIDQYVINHPEFIKENHPEDIFINPNNPFILFNHIKSAAFELPFVHDENFGSLSASEFAEYLDVLEEIKVLYFEKGKYFWISEKYPASAISIRSAGGPPIQLFQNAGEQRIRIGEIDAQSAKKFVHEGAIYLHGGDPFIVRALDFENNMAIMDSAFESEYYTKAMTDIQTKIMGIEAEHIFGDLIIGNGDVQIIETVKGFQRIVWDTPIVLSQEEITLDPDILDTKGVWFQFTDKLISRLNTNNKTTILPIEYGKEWEPIRSAALIRDNHQCQLCGKRGENTVLHVHHKVPVRFYAQISQAHAPSNLITLCASCHQIAEMNLRVRGTLSGFGFGLQNITPIFVKCSSNDIGYTAEQRIDARENLPGVLVYDQHPGGIGLSQAIFEKWKTIVSAFSELVHSCPCTDGCPSCVGPGGENGYGAKEGVTALLSLLGGDYIS